jgi:D-sedoheptulose 7-phosphate isomerase
VSFKATIIRHQSMVEGLFALESQIDALVKQVSIAIAKGNKVLFFGNGGSASDAQHLAAEFVIRYKEHRKPYAAIALTTDTSILTAHGNDYDFSTLFDRQIEALAKPGDIAIGLSTSGNSDNVINGFKVAKEAGCWTCAFTGQSGGQLLTHSDSCIQVPSQETARIQEGHIIIGHWLCEALDQAFISN